ncbi:MAG: hypothetical protein WC875_01070 [Candidatus Absconditabacterales bacterium]
MVSVYSVLVNNHDVIDQSIDAILAKNIVRLADEKVSEKMSKKIDEAIQFFLQSNTIPDGHYIKHVDGPIHEFRISIPCSKFFLRIFFSLEKSKLVLLTNHIIKPQEYDDKKNITQIDATYVQRIQESKTIYEDFKSTKHQKFRYAEIK